MAAHIPDRVAGDDDVFHERKFVIVSAKVINGPLGCSDHFASEHLRMKYISMNSLGCFGSSGELHGLLREWLWKESSNETYQFGQVRTI